VIISIEARPNAVMYERSASVLSVRRRTNGKNTFFSGLSEDAQIDYRQDPMSTEPFREELRLAASVHRMRRISEVFGIARNSLSLSHGDRLRLRRSWWLIRAMAPLDQVPSGQAEFERRFVTGFWQKSSNAGCEGSQNL